MFSAPLSCSVFLVEYFFIQVPAHETGVLVVFGSVEFFLDEFLYFKFAFCSCVGFFVTELSNQCGADHSQ